MKPILIISASVLVCVYTSYSPQQVMVDVTNDFGICVLQLVSSRRENVAFSPYGLVSVGLVLYEGANGPTAAEIHNTLRLPWDRHITRIGFRDLHRYLKSYFTNDGFLRGLVLSKPNVILHWNYTRQLQFYGFDLKPADTTTRVPTSTVQTTPMEPNPTSTPNAPTTTETPRTTTQPITTQQSSTTDVKTTEIMKEDTEPPKTVPTTTRTTNIITDIITPQSEDVLTTSTSPPITDAAPTTVKEKTKEPTTTQKVETTVGPLTEPMTTNIATETDKTTIRTTETTPEMEGRDGGEELTVDGDQKRETTTVQDRKAETTSESTTMPTLPQTTMISPQVTTSSQPESTEIEDDKQTTASMVVTTMRETVSPFPSTVPPTSTQTSTAEMEGRDGGEELTVDGDQKRETTTVQDRKAETTSESTTMPTLPQTTMISPQVTTSSQPESIEIEDDKQTTASVAETSMRETASPFPSTVPPTSTQTSTAPPSEMETVQPTVQETVTPASTTELTSISGTVPLTEGIGTSFTTSGETSDTPVATTEEENVSTNEITTQQTTQSGTEGKTETSRKKRAVYSKGNVPEHREGISNWVPHYQDPRWNYHAPLENWFFSYSGGERVPIITYSAYLPFAYLEDLATLALQLPLDDPRYYMLILLPEDRNGLEKLLYSLQWCPIRGILDQLKTTAVYATVPVFTIVKHVNLVPALAKLGILSVFDPSTADLSAMSSEKGIFVRTIEQVVTVSLRKYFANYRWFEAKPGDVEQHFIANHPFAYFVLDKETQVTLMTGTIVNPVAYNQ